TRRSASVAHDDVNVAGHLVDRGLGHFRQREGHRLAHLRIVVNEQGRAARLNEVGRRRDDGYDVQGRAAVHAVRPFFDPWGRRVTASSRGTCRTASTMASLSVNVGMMAITMVPVTGLRRGRGVNSGWSTSFSMPTRAATSWAMAWRWPTLASISFAATFRGSMIRAMPSRM